MRIIGIDVGATSVKAVEIDSAFRRYEIHEYHEKKIEAGVDPMQVAKDLVASLSRPPDRIAVAMKSAQMTFRNIELPTRDRKAIQTSLAFELEDDLPFSMDEAAYDYSIIGQVGLISHLHVATTIKQYLSDSVSRWQSVGLDPDLITTEAWAFRTMLNRILPAAPPAIMMDQAADSGRAGISRDKPLLLLHIGAERTIFYIHWGGSPVYAREALWGGRDLSTAICRKYGIPIEQAEQTKRDSGFVLSPSQRPQATPEQIEFSDTLLQPLEELLHEIRQCKLICKNVTHEPLTNICLTGSTSLLPGLSGLIEEEINVPTKPLHGLSTLAASGVTYSEQTDATFLLAASIALCLVGPERGWAINLRKGQYAKQMKSKELNLANLRRPLEACAAIAGCFLLSTLIQGQVYKSRLKSVDSQLDKSIRTFFGQISNSAVRTYLSNSNTLRESVKKELNKNKELARLSGPNPHSPIGFLKGISTSISSDAVVDMISLSVGSAPSEPYSPTEQTSAEMTFLITNPQVTEKVSTVLSGKMTGFERSKPEEVSSSDGGTKRWKVTFSGKPMEDVYGK